MSSSTRKQAPRLARPAARYWKGKAPKGVEDPASDDSDAEEEQQVDEEGDVLIGGDQDVVDEDEGDVDLPVRTENLKGTKSINIALGDVNISRDGKVIVAGREESGRTIAEGGAESSEEETDEDEEAPAGGESESSEDETSSEEEEAPKMQFRPVFVPKRNRVTIEEKQAIAQDTEEALLKREQEAEERKKQSHDLVADSIRRELAEKEKEEGVPDVDDTDDLDPEAEFEAWRFRELGRIKKEKEAEVQREEELAELERRRALPEAQRLREDMERAQKLREEKPKGQQKFLQKYWHKGAFHQDEEILQRHDYTEATQSTLDISLLPKVMQVKNFGKRSRTKYTHLLDQDTTAASGVGGTSSKPGGKSTDTGAGCFLCGGPHMKKDCPQNTGPLTERGGPPRSGANNMPTGPRDRDSSWREGSDRRGKREDSQERRRRHDIDRTRFNEDRTYRPSRSRSPRPKSPPPRREKYSNDNDSGRRERRRSRDRSVEGERSKRRRLD